MKKLTLITALFLTVVCNAQKKDSTARDSVVTNSTVLLSRSDASNALEGAMKYLEDKLTKQQWELVNNVFIQAFQQILAQREKEWMDKQKKKIP